MGTALDSLLRQQQGNQQSFQHSLQILQVTRAPATPTHPCALLVLAAALVQAPSLVADGVNSRATRGHLKEDEQSANLQACLNMIKHHQQVEVQIGTHSPLKG